MPAETMLFLDDKAHAWNSAVSIYGASSTAPGYSAEAVRDTSYAAGWKPNDGTADEYIEIDGGAADWLGTVSLATIYCVIAYDARAADQTTISLLQDGSDNPAGTFSTNKGTFTLSKTGITCDYLSFTLASGGKRYYRLMQLNSARGGLTRTATILAWGMFTASGVLTIGSYAGGNVSPGRSDLLDNVGHRLSPSGFEHVQAAARMQHDFELHIRRATKVLWTDLVNRFHVAGGGARAFYVQYEGLKNFARDDFQMARLGGLRWMSNRPMADDKFEVSVPMVTEAHA